MDVPLTLYLCLCIFLCLLLTTWRMHKRRLCLPPGPCPLPLLGNMLQGSTILYESYHKLSKQYGPVFTIWLGSAPVVALCGYEVVKDALINSQHFSTRGSMPISERLTQGYGLITTNGERWQKLRRFTVSTLRNLGMGKRSMEQRVQEEAQHLVQAISKTGGEEFNPQILLGRSVNNVINLIVFGKRWDYEDEKFLKFLQITNNLLNFIRAPLGLVYIAFQRIMRHLPGPHQKIFQDCEEVKSFIREQMHSHRDTLDSDSPRDYIDCFLIRAKEEEGSPGGEFCEENLVYSIFDLFMAGTETTANTFQFCLLVMIHFPHIQERLQQEIDTVIGDHCSPRMENRIQMPYTNAVVHEIQRFLDVAPMALPHVVTHDTFFRGFIIPKGTTVFPLLCSVLSDPCHWETPDEFNPGHFLDHKGAFYMKAAFMPFSAGKRICPGEGLARMEIFLFLTTVLQKFTFRTANHPCTLNLGTLRRAFRKGGLSFCLKASPRT
ncbi:cytochrome P450 2A4-like [Ascaphus truei]|uniref:cytochrome P450 2A4-like n=1 Tax=Ascaphus truei TaxID=8439 RepID=UPI003F5959FD